MLELLNDRGEEESHLELVTLQQASLVRARPFSSILQISLRETILYYLIRSSNFI